MSKTFEVSLESEQQAGLPHRILFTADQRAAIKNACGVAYNLWESRKTGFEKEIPFLIGWAAIGNTTNCCPCSCGAPCGLLLLHRDTPKGVARFTLIE